MRSKYLRAQDQLSDEEKEALKALRDEELSRNTPEGRARQAKLAAERRVIMSYVLYGNKEEIEILREAYKSSTTKPDTKQLIEECVNQSRLYSKRTDGFTF